MIGFGSTWTGWVFYTELVTVNIIHRYTVEKNQFEQTGVCFIVCFDFFYKHILKRGLCLKLHLKVFITQRLPAGDSFINTDLYKHLLNRHPLPWYLFCLYFSFLHSCVIKKITINIAYKSKDHKTTLSFFFKQHNFAGFARCSYSSQYYR